MPVNFTLPPDTRAVGTPDPAGDMDNVVDAVTAMGAGNSVLSTAYSGGADPAGAADSTAAIQAALTAGTAILPAVNPASGLPAVYKVSAPLVMPSASRLTAQHPARSFPVPTGNYGNAGLPLYGPVIRPSPGFTGSQVISLGNAPAAQTGGQYIRGITIDGSQLPASSAVAGIQAVGWVAGVTLREVLVWSGGGTGQMLGPGIDVRTDGSGHAPDFWDIAFCKVSAINGTGFNFTGLADSYILNCEATGNHGDNWNITNGGNSRFIGCKGESAGTGFGWNLTGNSSFTGTVQFTGCTSSVNSSGGWSLTGTGTGTYRLTDTVATDTTPYVITSTNTNTVQFAPPDAVSAHSPADTGFVAEAFDPVNLSNLGTVLTSGTPVLIGMPVKKPALATGIRIHVLVAAAGLTASQNFVGLLNSAGTVVGVSADQSGAWGVTNTPVDAALASGPFMLQPGWYWAVILANGTTPPSILRGSVNAGSTTYNGRSAAAAARWATNGTGQTSITARTPSSNTLTSNTYYAAIY